MYLVSMILLVATTGVVLKGGSGMFTMTFNFKGNVVLFGGKQDVLGQTVTLKGSTVGMIAFILAIVALVGCAAFATLKALGKLDNKINNAVLISMGVIAIIAAIMVFVTKSDFLKANGYDQSQAGENLKGALSGSYVTAGVLLIIGGLVNAVDPVLTLKD